ncbi:MULTISPECIES: Hsp20/alpha crystallin family protein [unclassified Saccharicrinis]|uniref:Hsp20/alpha crystallin family protein n=1 Tax=unclassified Saccharicrinis TaxID=2646859 RepID=UPI003D3276AE
MIPKLRGSSIYPSWVDDLFTGSVWQNLDSKMNTSMPAVNIKEDDNQFIIEVAAPGMDKSNFNVDLNHNVLTISAKKEEEREDKHTKVTRREFNFSSFQRSFTLPNFVVGEKIKAAYHDGILNISIPKKEEVKAKPPKKIEIN